MTDHVPQRGEPLTKRELEVVRLVADGRLNPAIASALNLSATTVKRHLDRIGLKLGVRDPAGIVGAALLTGQLRLNRSGSGVELNERLTATLIGIARGRSNAQIARDMGVSEHTVKSRVVTLLRKLGVDGRAAAVRAGVECGTLTLVPRQDSGRPAEASGRRCPTGAREAVTEAPRGRAGAVASEPAERIATPVPKSASQAPGVRRSGNRPEELRKPVSVALRPSPGCVPSDAEAIR